MFSGDRPGSTISAQVTRGDLVRLATGIYTTDTSSEPEDVVRSEVYAVAGRRFPGSVVSDRSARSGGPVDGTLLLVRDGRPGSLELPGMSIRCRPGSGPRPGDIPLPGGIFLASRARGMVENCRDARTRAGGPRATLSAEELGDWIDHVCATEGVEALMEIRDVADQESETLHVAAPRLARLHQLIGFAVGTRPADGSESGALRSRRLGQPLDQGRLDLFARLCDALRASSPQVRLQGGGVSRYLAFFETYFSNFIEGTEFEVDEAARIVFDHEVPTERPKDAHDVIGTYRVVADDAGMREVGADAEDFLDLLRRRHALVMEGRPEVRPGQLKQRPNRAGATAFVEPTLVEGTLKAGYRMREALDTAWERAVLVAFVVAEVHPFDDGNGRVARAMMNAELHRAGEVRIIVPTVLRTDYLDGLRSLSRRDDPSILIKVLRFAQDFTASVDFAEYARAKDDLDRAHAFNEPESPDRLRLLTPVHSDLVARPWRRA